MGRKFPLKLIPKVPAMHLLSLTPPTITAVEPFWTRVKFSTETYFTGVSSILILIEWRILYFSIIATISWRKKYSNFFLAPPGIVTFEDVFMYLTKLILLKILFAQLEESMSILPATSEYFSIRNLVVAVAKFVLIADPSP